MNAAAHFLEATLESISRRTAILGRRVDLDASVLDRSDSLTLRVPDQISANGACRMIRAADGWLAVNLPRADDLNSIPALLRSDQRDDAWAHLTEAAPRHACGELIERAEMLGLAMARIGEHAPAPLPRQIAAAPASRPSTLTVVDLSSLWAGPLCGSIFAAMGADVSKIESAERPDTTRISAPALNQRLNGAKAHRSLSFKTERAALEDAIASADILITSARARALQQLGLDPETLNTRHPALIWIAITGHGWTSARIAFGDDAAAAGGLVAWRDGAPSFVGDAIADPLTGLAAADAALDMLERRQAGFVDAALAQVAASAASAQRAAA